MATKRAYKLQEFVAHTSNVNCLKIGQRTSKIVATGGEDNKVNLWAIGKPTALLSLSGLSSPVESVCFDHNELQVAAGAASGTIKIWDVEEAKVVRTFTGHRSNCTSVTFHPFYDICASGSWDTNMKIWDLQRKECIHTYKGHTRGIEVLQFSPDGRWIVSGGKDKSVKIWDLTAGKLLCDLKFHKGPVQCIVFHPRELLLATGSADKSVKFWDLETFDMIGSSAPEYGKDFFGTASNVRSAIFNTDGKTLFCGLHESLKVLSWEPIRWHDMVDVGWSTLADLSVLDGKLLGCSYNQNCVGVWVVDLLKIKPYAADDDTESISSGASSLSGESSMTASMGRLSISKISVGSSSPSTPLRTSISKEAASFPTEKVSTGPLKAQARVDSSLNQDTGVVAPAYETSLKKVYSSSIMRKESSGSASITRSNLPDIRTTNHDSRQSNSKFLRKGSRINSIALHRKQGSFSPAILERQRLKADITFDPVEKLKKNSTNVASIINARMSLDAKFRMSTTDIVPDKIGTGVRVDMDFSKRVGDIAGASPYTGWFESSGFRTELMTDTVHARTLKSESGLAKIGDEVQCEHMPNPTGMLEPAGERSKAFAILNRNRRSCLDRVIDPEAKCEDSSCVAELGKRRPVNTFESLQRRRVLAVQDGSLSTSEADAISELIGQHKEFLTIWESQLAKLKVIFQLWQKNDVKGVIALTQRASDLAVTADVLGALLGNVNAITLDLCTSILPLAISLLDSKFDRHLEVALDMSHKMVQTFGPLICSTLRAAPAVGVDLQAEQRLERCSECYIQLDKLKDRLPAIIRLRGGSIGQSARELTVEILTLLDTAA